MSVRVPLPDLDALSAAVDAAADRLEWRLCTLIEVAAATSGDWFLDDTRICIVCLRLTGQCPGHEGGSK